MKKGTPQSYRAEYPPWQRPRITPNDLADTGAGGLTPNEMIMWFNPGITMNEQETADTAAYEKERRDRNE